jgi:hypothetical protein
MRTAKALALAAALTSAGVPVAAEAGGWYHHGGYGSGFWAGVGVVSGLIGIGILADALTRPDVVYVTSPPAYYPPAESYYPPAESSAPSAEYQSDAEERERDAYFAGYAAGRDAAADEEPYYPAPRAARTRAPRR